MRYSILALAPFVAAAYGQETAGTATPTVLTVSSASGTASSTYSYSNFMTNFLTLTNSYGVVTGQPTLSNPGTPVVVTSQPAVNTDVGTPASIPAGLAAGLHTIANGGNNLSTNFFTVSVGPSTTVVLSNTHSSATHTGATGGSGSGSKETGSSSSEETGSSGSGGNNASATGSAAASESSSAADAAKVASGAVIGLGAVFVALL